MLIKHPLDESELEMNVGVPKKCGDIIIDTAILIILGLVVLWSVVIYFIG